MNRDEIAARLAEWKFKLWEPGAVPLIELVDAALERADALALALEHATSSLEHLMAFKGSRLEETQRAGHEFNITRGREALAAYRGSV